MKTKILKDVTLKDKILGGVKSEIARLEEIHNKRPGIAFVSFMGVPLGKYNIPFHVQLAEGLGFQVFNEIQPDDITEADLFKRINERCACNITAQCPDIIYEYYTS